MDNPGYKNQQEIIRKLKAIEHIQSSIRSQPQKSIYQNIEQMKSKISKINKDIKSRISSYINNNANIKEEWLKIIKMNETKRTQYPKEYHTMIQKLFKIGKKSENKIIRADISPLFDNNNNPVYDIQHKEKIMQEFFETQFLSNQENFNLVKIEEEDIDFILFSKVPRFSYKKAPGKDGLCDIYFQEPKFKGPFQTIFDKEERDRQFLNHRSNLISTLKYMITDINNNINSIYKQGRQIYIVKDQEKMQLENCRPISILPLPIKLLEDIIYQHILDCKDIQPIQIRQTGFQLGKSTTFNIQKVIQLAKSKIKSKTTLYAIYYDFKGAFNTPDHNIMYKILQKRKFPHYIIQWIKWVYQNVTINGFYIRNGTLQGSKLSPILFNHYLDHVIHKTEKKAKINVEKFLFADDMACLSENIQKLIMFDKQFNIVTKLYKLIISKTKTECQVLTNQQEKNLQISENLLKTNFEYTVTRNFKYLGFYINTKLKMDPNMNKIKQSIGRFTLLMQQMKNQNIGIYNRYLTWNMYIKAQFIYAISNIKYISTKAKWEQLSRLYNKTLKTALAVPKSFQNDTLFNKIGFFTLEEWEQQYKKHIIVQGQYEDNENDIQIELQQENINNKNIRKKYSKFILQMIEKTGFKNLFNIIYANNKQKYFRCNKCQKMESIIHIIKHQNNSQELECELKKLQNFNWQYWYEQEQKENSQIKQIEISIDGQLHDIGSNQKNCLTALNNIQITQILDSF